MKLIYLTVPQYVAISIGAIWVSGWLGQFYPLWVSFAFTFGILFMFNGLGAALEIFKIHTEQLEAHAAKMLEYKDD